MNTKLEHKLRLGSGLVIAVFLVLHLLTAGLGLVSLSAMDAAGDVMHVIWSFPVLLVLLYASFLVHIALGLFALFKHRTWRMPVWNLLQIGLGLALPVLLIGHAMSARGTAMIFDVPLTYSRLLLLLWDDPVSVIKQYALMLIAWTHMCLGIHFWLRYRPWYSRWILLIYPLSLFIPLLAGMGFARAGVDTWHLQPEVIEQVTAAMRTIDPAARKALFLFNDRTVQVFLVLVGIVFVLRTGRDLYVRRSGHFLMTHTISGKTLRGAAGQSALEVMRAAGVKHASVCGGRGRCTTCRVRVKNQGDRLPAPEALESAALKRVGASANVRLACQIRPKGDITITPLLQPNISAPDVNGSSGVVGHEQQVACMFADLRGSTTLGEKKMPYDVVFILNHFFIQLADALKKTNGHYANFTGDGIMGLYGLESDIETGCREALEGAVEIQRRMDQLNHWLSAELDEPLKVGIGIHCGVAIVGTMGPPDAPITSAIGDNINIAARLEALTKDYATNLVVSEDVLKHAAVDYSNLPHHTAKVRGRGEAVEIIVVDDPVTLLGMAAAEA